MLQQLIRFSIYGLIACAVVGNSLYAERPDSIKLDKAVKRTIDISESIYFWIDSSHVADVTEAGHAFQAKDFQSFSSWTLASRFSRGKYAYWFAFHIHNATEDTLRPIFAFARYDSIHLYEDRKGWNLLRAYGRHLADDRHLDALPFPAQSAIVLPLPPKQSSRFLLRFRTVPGWTQDLQPRLMSQEVFLQNKTKPLLWHYLFQGGYISILFFMCVFTFLQFWGTRDQAFLFFGCFLLALFLFYARDFDIGDSWLNVLPMWFLTNVAYVPIKLFQYASYVLFVDRFLNAKDNHPRLHAFANWVLKFMLIFFVMERIIWYHDIWVSWKLFTGFRYAFFGVSFYFLFLLLRTPIALGRYIVIGTLILIGSVVITMVVSYMPNYVMGLWDLSNVSSNLGILCQIWFFSLGLGEKRKLAEREATKLEQQLLLQEQQTHHLQELDQVKSSFFTNITHELRTPLTVIIGLAEQVKGPAQAQILRNSQKLLHLINQMLELAKLEGGNPRLNWVQTDMIDYLNQLVEPFQYLAKQRERSFRMEIEAKHLMMDIDSEKIEAVLTNLLMNALKFTPKGGQILMTIAQDQDSLHLSIQDSGPGIATEHLPHIFDRFYRIESDTDPHTEGSGLGLALVKQLLELMGGSINVQSQVGKGSSFHLTLPIHRSAVIVSNPVFGEGFSLGSAALEPVSSYVFPSANDQPSQLPSILLIEDNPDLIQLIRDLLKSQYQIWMAKDGEEGKQIAISSRPHLIVSDIMLPKLDGISLCQSLKSHSATKDIPVILLTAKATQLEREDGLQAGADAYISKPFRKEELLIRIEQLLKQRQELQAHVVQSHLLGSIPSLDEAQSDFVARLSQIIEERLNQSSFGVEQLAAEMGLSRSQLGRRLKQLEIDKPASLIRQARLKKAQALLHETELSVNQVAFEVGFKDASYFAKLYQKEFGERPSAKRG
ncbi:MAG: ATP-binding protein [Bacteroidota bacterium]